MLFEWDEAKAQSNLRKHGISFGAASRVFLDPHVQTVQDRIEDGEYRWQSTGEVDGRRLVVVAHVDRMAGGVEVIRIISARHATPKEKRRYEQNR